MNSTELFVAREELKEQINMLKSELQDIEQQIKDMFYDQARDALRADGKDFGTTHMIAGNQKLKAVIRKKVVWDQDELGCVLEAMAPEDARHYGKLTLSVEERKYTAAPPAIKAKLEPCRSVEVGGFTVEVDN
jgi:uncharacterized membrane protein YqiK|tara:strand:- start:662 stop:1060 length:399 start_codon:yes stop_codon:yes gene_type:complete